MARKQVGRVPVLADDAVDKRWAEDALGTKYTKPPQGIPTIDLAPGSVSVDRIQATGAPTARSVLYGDGHWGVILGNFMVAEPTDDYMIQLPNRPPVDGEMVMIEVRPISDDIITVNVPSQVRLTSGLTRSYEVVPGTSFLLGIRWSQRADSWHLLTVAHEI